MMIKQKQSRYQIVRNSGQEYVNTVSVSDWGSVSKALKDSADTLKCNLARQRRTGIESH